MMMGRHIFTIAFTLFLAGGLISTSLYAQEKNPAPADIAPQQQQNFSNEEIQKFAKANEQVSKIANTYSAKIQKAPSQEEARILREEANKKMVQAVKAVGLDTATYNNIARSASQDPGLQRKIMEAQSH